MGNGVLVVGAVAMMLLVAVIAAIVIYVKRAQPNTPTAAAPNSGNGGGMGGNGGNMGGSGGGMGDMTNPPNVVKTVNSGGGSGQWINGTATYYIASEGGPQGADGSALVAFQSAAVPSAQYGGLVHKHFEIQSLPGKIWKVVDQCPDKGCKTFDLFVGTSVSSAHAIPNWQAGDIPIKYRWV